MSNEAYSVKNAIARAFTTLLAEKAYLDITVSDIIEKAQVARSSFYRNYGSIDDIIDYVADRMLARFFDEIFPAMNSTDEGKWREFLFGYFYSLKKASRQVSSRFPQNVALLSARMENKVRLIEEKMPGETIKDKYTSLAKLGLINSIGRKWVADGMKETPEEIINFIMSFILLF